MTEDWPQKIAFFPMRRLIDGNTFDWSIKMTSVAFQLTMGQSPKSQVKFWVNECHLKRTVVLYSSLR